MEFLQKIKFDTSFLIAQYKKTEERGFDAFRELKFERFEEREGYIIGSCFKFDGLYNKGNEPSYYDDVYDGESPSIKNTKRIDMWVVATGINEQYLVPKKPLDEHRYIIDIPKDDSNETDENDDDFPWDS